MQPRSIQETDLFTHVHWRGVGGFGGGSTLKTLTTAHQLCLHLDCYTKVHSPEFTVKQGEIGKLLEYKSWSL